MKAKKYIIPLLAGISLVSLASCGTKKSDPSSESSNSGDVIDQSSSSTDENYMGASLTQLSCAAGSAKTKYSLGEEFEYDGIYVSAVYADKTVKSLKKGQYTVDYSNFRSDKEGTYDIHVIFTQGTIRKTATYQVTVASILNKLSEKYLLGISASGMKTNYLFNEELDTTGLKVVATYSDNSEVDVTDKVTCDYKAYDKSKMGAYMLKFNYKETYTLANQSETKSSDTFILAVVDGNLSGINFVSGTTSIEQDTVGPDGTLTSLDMSDWKVVGTFVNKAYDEIEAEIPYSDLTISGFNSGIAGSQTATIKYSHNNMSRECSVNLTVNAIADPDYTFNCSNLTQANNTSLTEETLIDSIISAGAKCQIKEESSAKTFGSMSFTKRIQTNGVGHAGTQNYLKFTLTHDATVAIIGRASAASKPVTAAGFYDQNDNLVSTSFAYSTDISKYKYELKAGTYYFFDPTYAVQVYGVQIWYK